MSKLSSFPDLYPGYDTRSLKGLTLWELYARKERNDRNIKLLKCWLDDIQDPLTYEVWKEFDVLRRRINRAIYLKRLKNYLSSLVFRN